MFKCNMRIIPRPKNEVMTVNNKFCVEASQTGLIWQATVGYIKYNFELLTFGRVKIFIKSLQRKLIVYNVWKMKTLYRVYQIVLTT